MAISSTSTNSSLPLTGSSLSLNLEVQNNLSAPSRISHLAIVSLGTPPSSWIDGIAKMYSGNGGALKVLIENIERKNNLLKYFELQKIAYINSINEKSNVLEQYSNQLLEEDLAIAKIQEEIAQAKSDGGQSLDNSAPKENLRRFHQIIQIEIQTLRALLVPLETIIIGLKNEIHSLNQIKEGTQFETRLFQSIIDNKSSENIQFTLHFRSNINSNHKEKNEGKEEMNRVIPETYISSNVSSSSSSSTNNLPLIPETSSNSTSLIWHEVPIVWISQCNEYERAFQFYRQQLNSAVNGLTSIREKLESIKGNPESQNVLNIEDENQKLRDLNERVEYLKNQQVQSLTIEILTAQRRNIESLQNISSLSSENLASHEMRVLNSQKEILKTAENLRAQREILNKAVESFRDQVERLNKGEAVNVNNSLSNQIQELNKRIGEFKTMLVAVSFHLQFCKTIKNEWNNDHRIQVALRMEKILNANGAKGTKRKDSNNQTKHGSKQPKNDSSSSIHSQIINLSSAVEESTTNTSSSNSSSSSSSSSSNLSDNNSLVFALSSISASSSSSRQD